MIPAAAAAGIKGVHHNNMNLAALLQSICRGSDRYICVMLQDLTDFFLSDTWPETSLCWAAVKAQKCESA